MTNEYLKISSHRAYPYDGTEERATEFAAMVGEQRAEPHYFKHIGITGAEKQFTGKLAIYGRNGVSYILPGEILMHDVVSNEWYPVTQEQFARQYRAFVFQNCNTPLCTIDCAKVSEQHEANKGVLGVDDPNALDKQPYYSIRPFDAVSNTFTVEIGTPAKHVVINAKVSPETETPKEIKGYASELRPQITGIKK